MVLPERAAELFGRNGFRVMGGVGFFPRCPAALVSPFTGMMLEWFLWLQNWNKTPFDVGFSPGSGQEIDPRYFPAMNILKREMNRIEREELDAAKEKN